MKTIIKLFAKLLAVSFLFFSCQKNIIQLQPIGTGIPRPILDPLADMNAPVWDTLRFRANLNSPSNPALQNYNAFTLNMGIYDTTRYYYYLADTIYEPVPVVPAKLLIDTTFIVKYNSQINKSLFWSAGIITLDKMGSVSNLMVSIQYQLWKNGVKISDTTSVQTSSSNMGVIIQNFGK